MSIFGEVSRQIGGIDDGRAIISASLNAGRFYIVTAWQGAGASAGVAHDGMHAHASMGMPAPLDAGASAAQALSLARKQEGAYIACVDGGYAFAKAAGVVPDAVIGDFDSLPPHLLDELGLGVGAGPGAGADARVGAPPVSADTGSVPAAAPDAGLLPPRPLVLRHPKEKDDTDTMLCAKHGLALGYSDFLIVGGIGGSFGHTVANLQTLSFLADMECSAAIESGGARVFMLDGGTAKPAFPVQSSQPAADAGAGAGAGAGPELGIPPGGMDGLVPPIREAVFSGRAGQVFSVFSWAERTVHVSISGAAKYTLSDAVLTQSYPIGARNEFAHDGEVALRTGLGRLLVVVEG